MTRFVSFEVFSDARSPGELTDRIGLVPDEYWVKGEPVRAHRSGPLAKWHLWSLKERGGNDVALITLVDAIVARIGAHDRQIRLLTEEGLATAHLGMWWTEGDQVEATFPWDAPPGYERLLVRLTPRTVSWLAFMHASFEFD